MLNDITIVECEVMSHLVRLRGKDTVQCAHCAVASSPGCVGSIRGSALLAIPGVGVVGGRKGGAAEEEGVLVLGKDDDG